jgi:hypothetical protein
MEYNGVDAKIGKLGCFETIIGSLFRLDAIYMYGNKRKQRQEYNLSNI